MFVSASVLRVLEVGLEQTLTCTVHVMPSALIRRGSKRNAWAFVLTLWQAEVRRRVRKHSLARVRRWALHASSAVQGAGACVGQRGIA